MTKIMKVCNLLIRKKNLRATLCGENIAFKSIKKTESVKLMMIK